MAIKAHKAKIQIKDRALSHPRDRPEEVVGDIISNQDDVVTANMPQLRTLTRLVRKNRSGIISSSNFNSVRDVVIPAEVTDLDGSSILHYDSGSDDPERFLIFSTEELKNVARTAKHFNMDGTFKIVPNIFYQLYTIQCWANGSVIPVFYVLMTGKSQELYGRVFQIISDVIETERTDLHFMIDLEIAALNAIKEKFPQSSISCCSFHFRQVLIL